MMNKVIIFTVGAAAGSLLTWKLLEEKYKRIADEEINSVIEHYKNKDKKKEENGELEIAEHYVEVDELDNVKREYAKKITDLQYADDDATVIQQPVEDVTAPYVISPDEYGETQYYDSKSLTYYADFVLADDEGEIICDPENLIGDALAHFGDYEEDAVHVRNEYTECDYEILKTEKTFSEVYGEDI